mmetsp:Transcript_57769/g.151928  ORF Transcript_57769/g.151928 Transcript_57769/m.151928 type:complete len:792 (+) Transcript_57769:374-2749(+)
MQHVPPEPVHARRGDQSPAHLLCRGIAPGDRVLHDGEAVPHGGRGPEELLPQRRAPRRARPARLQGRLVADDPRLAEVPEDRAPVEGDVLHVRAVEEGRGARLLGLVQEDLPLPPQAEEVQEALGDHLRHVVVHLRGRQPGGRVPNHEVADRDAQDREHLLLYDVVDVHLVVAGSVVAVQQQVLGAEASQQHADVAVAGRGEEEEHREELQHEDGEHAQGAPPPAAADQRAPEELADDRAARRALEARDVLHDGGAGGAVRGHQDRGGAGYVGVVRRQHPGDAAPARVVGEEEPNGAANRKGPAIEVQHVPQRVEEAREEADLRLLNLAVPQDLGELCHVLAVHADRVDEEVLGDGVLGDVVATVLLAASRDEGQRELALRFEHIPDVLIQLLRGDPAKRRDAAVDGSDRGAIEQQGRLVGQHLQLGTNGQHQRVVRGTEVLAFHGEDAAAQPVVHVVSLLAQLQHVEPHAPWPASVVALPPGVAAGVVGELLQQLVKLVALADELVDEQGLLVALEVLDHAVPEVALLPGDPEGLVLGLGQARERAPERPEAEGQHREDASDDRAHERTGRLAGEHNRREVAEVGVVARIQKAHGEVRIPRHPEHADARGPLEAEQDQLEDHEVGESAPPHGRVQPASRLRGSGGALREEAVHDHDVDDGHRRACDVVPGDADGRAQVLVHREDDHVHDALHGEAVVVDEIQFRDEVGQAAEGAHDGDPHGQVGVVREPRVEVRPEEHPLHEAGLRDGLDDAAPLVEIHRDVRDLAPDRVVHAQARGEHEEHEAENGNTP